MNDFTEKDLHEMIFAGFNQALSEFPQGEYKELYEPLIKSLEKQVGNELPKHTPLASMGIGYCMGFMSGIDFLNAMRPDDADGTEQSGSPETAFYRVERKDTRHGKYGKLQYAIYTKGDFTDRELAAFDTIEAAAAAIRYLTGAPMQEDERQKAITSLQAIDRENAEKEAKKTAERAARRAKKDATAIK